MQTQQGGHGPCRRRSLDHWSAPSGRLETPGFDAGCADRGPNHGVVEVEQGWAKGRVPMVGVRGCSLESSSQFHDNWQIELRESDAERDLP
jgi:hypothetical protein